MDKKRKKNTINQMIQKQKKTNIAAAAAANVQLGFRREEERKIKSGL